MPLAETAFGRSEQTSPRGAHKSRSVKKEMGKLDNKITIVTGAGSGIGEATAKLFAAEGARVIIADIDDEGGKRVTGEIGSAAAFRHTDVGVPSEVEGMIKFALDRFGRVDVLFNNAFATTWGPVGEMPLDGWHKTLSVTLSGVFYGMRFALPQMVAQGGGAIVNTASISGLGGDYGAGAYNAAKAGVVNLTRTAAIEYARKNIRVNAVCPGVIATPAVLNGLIARSRNPERARQRAEECHPMGRLGKPEEIARVVLFLASDDASFMTGSMMVVDGGVTAHTGLMGHPL
jgi:meso-butanediol dehydrogenase / (S,S)-butanediol dehydrogenase / diacetyl reductase